MEVEVEVETEEAGESTIVACSAPYSEQAMRSVAMLCEDEGVAEHADEATMERLCDTATWRGVRESEVRRQLMIITRMHTTHPVAATHCSRLTCRWWRRWP